MSEVSDALFVDVDIKFVVISLSFFCCVITPYANMSFRCVLLLCCVVLCNVP